MPKLLYKGRYVAARCPSRLLTQLVPIRRKPDATVYEHPGKHLGIGRRHAACCRIALERGGQAGPHRFADAEREPLVKRTVLARMEEIGIRKRFPLSSQVEG